MFTQHWLASLPFPVSARAVIDGERRGGDLLTERHRHAVTDGGAARYSSAVVQGHTTVYLWTICDVTTSLVVIRPPQSWLDSATKVIF